MSPPVRSPTLPPGDPRQLRPVQWGRRDPALAAVILRHMQDANPPVTLLWHPKREAALRFLESAHVPVHCLIPVAEQKRESHNAFNHPITE